MCTEYGCCLIVPKNWLPGGPDQIISRAGRSPPPHPGVEKYFSLNNLYTVYMYTISWVVEKEAFVS